MTDSRTSPIRVSPTSVRLPGVASTAIHGVITGPATEATVLANAENTVWLRIGPEIIAITIGGARRPNGIKLPEGTGVELLDHIDEESTVVIGNGRIVIGELSVTAAKWWDPHPRPPAANTDELEHRIENLPDGIPGIETGRLQAALAAMSAGGILHSSRYLLGRGLGLTPEGDDLLVGALAATRVLGEATGKERLVSLIAGISTPLVELADARTNMLSAASIRLALRGQIVESAGDLLCALAGLGDVAASHVGLIRLNRTSGPALAAGIALAARALVESAKYS
jgi:hypothetical protein